MKLRRFNDQRFGIVEGETIRDVSGALSVLPARRGGLQIRARRFDY